MVDQDKAKRVKRFVKSLKIKQEDLSIQCGYSRPSVNTWLNGKRPIPDDFIKWLCDNHGGDWYELSGEARPESKKESVSESSQGDMMQYVEKYILEKEEYRKENELLQQELDALRRINGMTDVKAGSQSFMLQKSLDIDTLARYARQCALNEYKDDLENKNLPTQRSFEQGMEYALNVFRDCLKEQLSKDNGDLGSNQKIA